MPEGLNGGWPLKSWCYRLLNYFILLENGENMVKSPDQTGDFTRCRMAALPVDCFWVYFSNSANTARPALMRLFLDNPPAAHAHGR